MIDFDRSTLRIPATGWREGNLARLKRSLLKLRGHRSIKEVVEDFARLRKRSEEHTSELQSLMRSSYAVFCLKKKRSRNPPQAMTQGLRTNNMPMTEVKTPNTSIYKQYPRYS